MMLVKFLKLSENKHNISDQLQTVFTSHISQSVNNVKEEIAAEAITNQNTSEFNKSNYLLHFADDSYVDRIPEINNFNSNYATCSQEVQINNCSDLNSNWQQIYIDEAANQNAYLNKASFSKYLKATSMVESESSAISRRIEKLSNSVERHLKPLINNKSKRLAIMRNPAHIGVHERLHKQALVKQKYVKMRDSINNSFCNDNRFDISELETLCQPRIKGKSANPERFQGNNCAERLYQQGIIHMKKTEKYHQEAILAKEESEVMNLTFHPQINPVSYFYGNRDFTKTEDYLINQGNVLKNKLEQK